MIMIRKLLTGRQLYSDECSKRWQRWVLSPLAILACAGMLALAGCISSGASTAPRHYGLDVEEPVATPSSAAQPNSDKVLRIAQIAVPQWLADTAMYYRLAYRNGNRLTAYAYSNWAAPPAALLEAIIQNTFAASGGWQAVVGADNPAAADTSLQLHLEDFSQRFAQPDLSAGVIEATATLIDDQGEQVIAQQHFSVRVPAPTPDAQGGVKALSVASQQLADDLQHWVSTAMNAAGRQ